MAILLLIRAKGVQFETYISVHTCSHKFLLIFQAVRDKEVSNAGARDGDMHFATDSPRPRRPNRPPALVGHHRVRHEAVPDDCPGPVGQAEPAPPAASHRGRSAQALSFSEEEYQIACAVGKNEGDGRKIAKGRDA